MRKFIQYSVLLITACASVAFADPVIEDMTPAAKSTIDNASTIRVYPEDPDSITTVVFYLNDPFGTPRGTVLATDRQSPFVLNVDTSLLPDKSAKIYAMVFDKLNTRTIVSKEYLVDKTDKLPVAFIHPIVNPVFQGTVSLRVTAYDIEKIVSLQLYVDGVRVEAITDFPFYFWKLDTTVFPDGKHYISVVATDSVNQSTKDTKLVTFNNHEDVLPPYLQVTSHAQGQTVKGITRVEATAFDETGIDRVEFEFGGQPVGILGSEPYAIDINTYLYANAVYDLVVTAYDKSGLATKATVFLAVQNNQYDLQESTILISSPRKDTTVAGLADVTILALDNVAFKNVELSINDQPLINFALPPYRYILETKNYKDGPYTLRVVGTDYANNVKEHFINFKINNSDLREAIPNETVNDITFQDNLKAASGLLNQQIASIDYEKATAKAEVALALKGTVDSMAKIAKKNTKALKADKSTKRVPELTAEVVAKTKELLKAKKAKSFAESKKRMQPTLKKLSKAFGNS